jgi:uncharacterized membrane protein YoaK (UPF0700 family)
MSGNTTRLGVGLAERSSTAAIAASLIALFVLGVVLGASVGRLAKANRPPMVLILVSALLVVAATLAHLGAMAHKAVGLDALWAAAASAAGLAVVAARIGPNAS